MSENKADRVSLPELATFARNFKAAREAAGLSQREIHRRTGIAYTYISRLENCLEGVSLETMVILANAVNKPLHKLLAPDDQGQSHEGRL